MEFTYNCYAKLINTLKVSGYELANYHDWQTKERCVILRHDIDNDVNKAVEMAKFERNEKVKSTYFVLLTSDFYNVFSKKTNMCLKEIAAYGHELGLHFDEVRYYGLSVDEIKEQIIKEAKLLEQAIELPVTTVSMHRPSKEILEANLQIPGIINSYGNCYFKEFKYLSDSRRQWREPVEDIIKTGLYNRLHILTHAFWYNDYETNIHDSIKNFVNKGSADRYASLVDNITNLELIMTTEEIAGGNL